MASMNERTSRHFSTMVDLRMTQLNTMIETMTETPNEDSMQLREWLEYNGRIRGFEAIYYFF